MGLFEQARQGDGRALARLTTMVENDDRPTLAALDDLGPPPTNPQVIGLTGPPGAGKSTLINGLLHHLGPDCKIAVLLVDPSSQTTGGAVLGDRVRMLEWGDSRVFVRSQANRGQEGGLAPSTAALVDLFAHLGFDLIVIETVGVGQDGIDIQSVCDTTIVIQSPQSGDVVQSLKAGILEIADIYVVTKADLPGSHNTVRDLNNLVQLGEYRSDDWVPVVLQVSAQENRGFDLLASTIEHHRETGSHIDRTARQRWETQKRSTSAVKRAIRSGSADSGNRDDRVRAALRTALAELEQPR